MKKLWTKKRNAQQNAWRAKNRKKVNARQRKYYVKHRDRILARHKVEYARRVALAGANA